MGHKMLGAELCSNPVPAKSLGAVISHPNLGPCAGQGSTTHCCCTKVMWGHLDGWQQSGRRMSFRNWEELAAALGNSGSLLPFRLGPAHLPLSLSSFPGAEGGEHLAHPHRVS